MAVTAATPLYYPLAPTQTSIFCVTRTSGADRIVYDPATSSQTGTTGATLRYRLWNKIWFFNYN